MNTQKPIQGETHWTKDVSSGALLNTSRERVDTYFRNVAARIEETKQKKQQLTAVEDRVTTLENKIDFLIDLIEKMGRNNASY